MMITTIMLKGLIKKVAHMPVDQTFYLWCLFKNRHPFYHLDPRLHMRQFSPLPLPDVIDWKGSPSRILSNIFWMKLPWDHMVEELKEIRVMDTGCGSGKYGELLNTYSGGRIAHYTGIDIYEHPDWQKLTVGQKFNFYTYNGKCITPFISANTNFFISQSAIEHFANDKRYFKEIKRWIDEHSSRPVMQIHLFPSAACLALYRRHGFRQYTPRTISAITRLFPDSECLLFGLGGPACNRLHDEFITKPMARRGTDDRETKSAEYVARVREAVQQDSAIAPKDPSFWALIICSNWKKPISL